MDFDELKQVMLASGSLKTGRGALEAEIGTAESVLGVSIRGDFRTFLLEFGWGGIGHLELYGLGGDVPRHLDLIGLTKSERTEMNPRLPPQLVPIMNDGGGNLYCIDTRSEGPNIVFWDHESGPGQTPTIEADDFSTWFGGKVAML